MDADPLPQPIDGLPDRLLAIDGSILPRRADRHAIAQAHPLHHPSQIEATAPGIVQPHDQRIGIPRLIAHRQEDVISAGTNHPGHRDSARADAAPLLFLRHGNLGNAAVRQTTSHGAPLVAENSPAGSGAKTPHSHTKSPYGLGGSSGIAHFASTSACLSNPSGGDSLTARGRWGKRGKIAFGWRGRRLLPRQPQLPETPKPPRSLRDGQRATERRSSLFPAALRRALRWRGDS